MSEAMMPFQLIQPTSVDEAISALGAEGSQPVSGGTDLIVRLRKGLSETGILVDLTGIAALKEIVRNKEGMRIGAGVSLAEMEQNSDLADYPAVIQAIKSVAAPSHREIATLGGNLCLDTRCVYYNQSHWWRKSNQFCLKYRGDICHVAPKGNRCRAAFTGDIAPALMVYNAQIEIASPKGTRYLLLADFYKEDGAAHTVLKPSEIVTAVQLPPSRATSDYRKVRVRGSVDFPLAGVAVARTASMDGIFFTLAVTGTNSKPVLIKILEPLGTDPEVFFADLKKIVQKAVSPQRTTTIAPHYRRLSVSALAVRLARQLAQDGE